MDIKLKPSQNAFTRVVIDSQYGEVGGLFISFTNFESIVPLDQVDLELVRCGKQGVHVSGALDQQVYFANALPWLVERICEQKAALSAGHQVVVKDAPVAHILDKVAAEAAGSNRRLLEQALTGTSLAIRPSVLDRITGRVKSSLRPITRSRPRP